MTRCASLFIRLHATAHKYARAISLFTFSQRSQLWPLNRNLNMPIQHQPLSRTSSSSSVLSDGTVGTSTNDEMGPPDTPSSGVTDTAPKRTRKRFTNAQLTLLEDLFHQTSHPTRDQRDTLAKEAGLCVFAFSSLVYCVPDSNLVLFSGYSLQGTPFRDCLVPKQTADRKKSRTLEWYSPANTSEAK